MKKTANVLGAVGSAVILLSCLLHTFLGWPAVRENLVKAATPADLQQGLMVSWQFGGAAMLVMGTIAFREFVRRLRGRGAELAPPLVIGAAYTAFGGWALAISSGEPFYFIFLVPGVLILFGAMAGR